MGTRSPAPPEFSATHAAYTGPAATVAMAQEKTAVVNMVDLARFHPSRERDRKLMQDTEKEYQAKLDKQRDRFEQLFRVFIALVFVDGPAND